MALTTAIPIGVVIVACLLAVVSDVRAYRIYNVLTVPLLFSGLIYHIAVHGWEGLCTSAGGILFAVAVLILPYMMGAMGSGDVKLVAAIGSWLGVLPILCILVVGLVATALYSLVVLSLRGRLRDTWINLRIVLFRLRSVGQHLLAEERSEVAKSKHELGRVIPFSIMVGIGLVATLVWHHLIEFGIW